MYVYKIIMKFENFIQSFILCIKFSNVENNIICFIDNIFYFKIFFIITNKYNIW